MFTQRLKSLLLFLLALALLVATGCSKDDDNPVGPENENAYLWVHLEGDSVQVNFDDLNIFDITTLAKAADENDAIWLKDFISTDLIPNATDKDGNTYEARGLYAYRIQDDVGYCAANKGYADNTWDQMGLGYVLVDAQRVVFPDDLIDLPGAYNVKDVSHIRVYRKFDVISSDTTGFTSINGLTVVQAQNSDGENEDAIALADFITPLVANPEGKTYTLTSVDGYTPPEPLTWEQMQTGHWLLGSKSTIFTHADRASGKYRVKFLESITVTE